MDAVVYGKTLLRMCKSHPACGECPLQSKDGCMAEIFGDIEKVVPIVEQWAKDHPVKTRQSEFLKVFPDAKTKGGVIAICPNDIDSTYRNVEYCNHNFCEECRKEYWLEEVDE